MGLNKSTGNMYNWVTHTWNTVKGACYHDCSYCYMKRYGKLNPVRFDEKEFKEFDRDIKKYGEGLSIFVGSSCDMFAEAIHPEWVIKTLNHCEKFDNKYLFQTKNPKAFSEYGVNIASLDNFSLCTTIETNRFYKEFMGNTPKPHDRSIEMLTIPIKEKYVTIEPIIDFDVIEFLRLLTLFNPIQVNIGANTSNIKLPEPSKQKILELILELEKFTIVKQKNNLKRLL